MGNSDKEIEQKLKELELSLKETSDGGQLTTPKRGADVTTDTGGSPDPLTADLYMTGGFGLLLLGVLLFFQHIRISTPYVVSWFGYGQGGFGLLLIPLMIGIAMLLYDYKMRMGWVLTVASVAVIFFAVLSQLVMTFSPFSLLGLMIMLLPLAGGAALIAKGIVHKKTSVKVSNNSD